MSKLTWTANISVTPEFMRDSDAFDRALKSICPPCGADATTVTVDKISVRISEHRKFPNENVVFLLVRGRARTHRISFETVPRRDRRGSA
jgi:hypothetical protein